MIVLDQAPGGITSVRLAAQETCTAGYEHMLLPFVGRAPAARRGAGAA
jgi:hypothetical protein